MDGFNPFCDEQSFNGEEFFNFQNGGNHESFFDS